MRLAPARIDRRSRRFRGGPSSMQRSHPRKSRNVGVVPKERGRERERRIDRSGEPSIAGGRIGQRGGQLSRREEQCTRRCLGRETVAVPVIGRVVLPVE